MTFLKFELGDVRVILVHIAVQHDGTTVESVKLGFSKIRVVYTPQSSTGGKGGGDVTFEADANAVI